MNGRAFAGRLSRFKPSRLRPHCRPRKSVTCRRSYEIAREDTPISRLFPVLSRGQVCEALVVDAEGKLLGIVPQTDLLAVVGRVQLALS